MGVVHDAEQPFPQVAPRVPGPGALDGTRQGFLDKVVRLVGIAGQRKGVTAKRQDMVFEERVHLDQSRSAHIRPSRRFSPGATQKNRKKIPAGGRRFNQRLPISRFAHQIAGMTHIDDRRLDRRFERLERQLPASAARTLRWLRDPGSTWVRIPTGVLLIIGGLLSFLPILGIWMLPLGIAAAGSGRAVPEAADQQGDDPAGTALGRMAPPQGA